MTNRILDQYLNDVERHLRGLSSPQRQNVLREMRAHLQEEILRRREADPQLSLDEATLGATHAFGEPQEIGVSYGPHGGEVRNQAGEVLLRVAHATGRGLKATGRGLGRTLKWSLIVLLVLFLTGVTAGLVVLAIFQDDIREAFPRELYQRNDRYDNRTGTFEEVMVVPEHYRAIDIHLWVSRQGASSCAAITILSPSGKAVLDTGDGCSTTNRQVRVEETGTYTITYRLETFTGSVNLYATGFTRA
jgi:hypothetical protein